jgi:3',5'-cyclic AMP phosphodiesterase CpdA
MLFMVNKRREESNDESEADFSMNNRFKRITGFLAAAALLCAAMAPVALADENEAKLRFNENGQFKIMQMSDFQDYVSADKPEVNPKSIALMNAALDAEKPDVVVMTGDMIGGDMNAEQLQDYIAQMVKPMEDRQIPWLVTFGNHDEDAVAALDAGWNKIKQLEYYRSFPYNINQPSMSGAEGLDANGKNTHAVGDMYQLVYDNAGVKPMYNIWALDSNRYDSSAANTDGYDWLHFEQVEWYYNASKTLEEQYGKLNALMFYHIPTPEWADMAANAMGFKAAGDRYEVECPAVINSGLFAAALQRGDVRGMFVGHDHVNDYVGNYYGIYLGYDANVGYQTYGLGGDNNDRLRGVRVFELDQSDLSIFTTRMVFAADLGVNQ